jgi:uncharacterized membrane protein
MKLLKNILNNLDKFALIAFNLTIFLYLFGGIFAPIARYLNLDTIADFLYFIYGFMCHQKAERSIHFFDYQMAFCTRDFSIFLSAQIIGLVALFKEIKIPSIKILIALTLPIIFDGGIQLISELFKLFFETGQMFYESTNFIRFVTGSFFGITIGLFIFSSLQKQLETKKKKEISLRKLILATFLISFFIYTFSIFIWNQTSNKYKPSNFLDTENTAIEKGRKLHIK